MMTFDAIVAGSAPWAAPPLQASPAAAEFKFLSHDPEEGCFFVVLLEQFDLLYA
jgi:hypothetical protein